MTMLYTGFLKMEPNKITLNRGQYVEVTTPDDKDMIVVWTSVYGNIMATRRCPEK